MGQAPGTAGMGDLLGSSCCTIEEVGSLAAQELWASLGKPQQPRWEGPAAALCLQHLCTCRAQGSCRWSWVPPPVRPQTAWEVHLCPRGETPMNRPPGAAAAGEARRLTFVQGQEQGENDGAPGSGRGDHSGGGAHVWTSAGNTTGAGNTTSAGSTPVASVLLPSRADSSLLGCPGCLL